MTVSCMHGFAVGAFEDLPADAGVFAFGVLAHDVEVDVAGFAAGQRAGHPGHQPDRPQAHVLVEGAAELQQAAPQRDVVGHHVGPADRAEEDRVEPAQFLEPVVGQHLPVLEVVVGAGVVEVLVVEVQVERGGCGVEDAQAFGDDFGADSVAGDDGDAVGSRTCVVFLSGVRSAVVVQVWSTGWRGSRPSRTSMTAWAAARPARVRASTVWPARCEVMIDVVQAAQGAVGGQWFDVDDVERGAGDLAGVAARRRGRPRRRVSRGRC